MFRMTFTKALFISLLWHAFCIFSIVIVISPVSTGREKFSKINFLGAILDNETFGFYKQNKDFGYEKKSYIAKKLTKDDIATFPFAEKKLKFVRLESYINRPYANSITEIIKETKDLPADIFMQAEKADIEYSPQIKSEVAMRQVLYKPPKPVVSRTFQVEKIPSKGEKFQIKLRFFVSPEGNVVFIEKVKSCGYPDIDLIAIRYIQKWQFIPLAPNKPRKNQEGIMLLELEAQ